MDNKLIIYLPLSTVSKLRSGHPTKDFLLLNKLDKLLSKPTILCVSHPYPFGASLLSVFW